MPSSSDQVPQDDGRPLSVSVVGFALTLVATTLMLVVFVAVSTSGWNGEPTSVAQPPTWTLPAWIWSAGIGTVALILDVIAHRRETFRAGRSGMRLTSVGLAMCVVGATAAAFLFMASANASL